MKAIILAGGKGTRLAPFTATIPKPLFPVGQKTILEIIINQLRQAKVREIKLAVGYLAELIEAYFGNGKRFGVSVSYGRERKPLGTAGPINFMRGEKKGGPSVPLFGQWASSIAPAMYIIARSMKTRV